VAIGQIVRTYWWSDISMQNREIVLDTETTGVDARSDRIVEIGCVELLNHVPTGRTFHRYLNPQYAVSAGAFAVHGLSNEFLADKPLFAAIAGELEDFIADGTLVIHNASFDVGFLNAERARAARGPLDPGRVIDTLAMARRKHPGASNSLDALCLRYGIDNAKRIKHGALLDAEILAEVYIELIGGKQAGLALNAASETRQSDIRRVPAKQRSPAIKARLTEMEMAAHTAFIETMGTAIWSKYRSDV
jgi:DNA polymerase III subunit epsilon